MWRKSVYVDQKKNTSPTEETFLAVVSVVLKVFYDTVSAIHDTYVLPVTISFQGGCCRHTLTVGRRPRRPRLQRYEIRNLFSFGVLAFLLRKQHRRHQHQQCRTVSTTGINPQPRMNDKIFRCHALVGRLPPAAVCLCRSDGAAPRTSGCALCSAANLRSESVVPFRIRYDTSCCFLFSCLAISVCFLYAKPPALLCAGLCVSLSVLSLSSCLIFCASTRVSFSIPPRRQPPCFSPRRARGLYSAPCAPDWPFLHSSWLSSTT